MLISEEYRAQQAQMHQMYEYGIASKKYAPLVAEIINTLGVQHVLDYGCSARMNLAKSLQGKVKHTFKYQGYDPAVPELAGMPVPAEMVCCIDVLEHIEPDLLDNVLDHIASLTEAVAFITVHCGPAGKKLPDGRNAHLTQQPMEWWLPKLMDRFELQTIQKTHELAFHVIGHPKLRLEKPNGEKLISQ